ncbi:MAG: hypothetical protein FJY55_05865 [Betaproteobacteria bacterium]|nr:hypothetical protein [Betaproteobacteria bacterium]
MKWSRHWLWLLLLPVLLGLARLRLDVDVLNLLPAGVPAVEGVKLYQQHFANARELILTVRAPEAETAEQAARSLAETLRAATNLTAAATWQPPWLEQPAQAAELVATLWLNQPPEHLQQLAARLAPERLPATLAAVREQLTTSLSPTELGAFGYDPFGFLKLPEGVSGTFATPGQGQELFASTDGRFRLVFVRASGTIANYRECVAWLAAVQERVARWQLSQPAGVVVKFTGGAAFEAEISSGMERDMTGSVGVTSLIIAVLFWLAHRRLAPMLWLLTLLGLILGATLALGGLIFGAINVVSLGFAGILLGLAVDYGVMHYQEALASPEATLPEIRRAVGPSILWAAVTTISAFLVLNLGGMPGLAQLGSLVALGVALTALVMLFVFLPPLFRDREQRRRDQVAAGTYVAGGHTPVVGPAPPVPVRQSVLVYTGTGVLLLLSILLLVRGLPQLDQSPQALRPRNSAAYGALAEIQTHFTRGREPLWLLTTARDEETIAQRLARATPLLERAVSNRFLASFMLPTPLWPHPEHQAANRLTAAQLVSGRGALHAAAAAAGFSTNAGVLANRILDTWQAALATPNVFWPTNETSRWVLEKITAQRNGEFMVVGLVTLAADAPSSPESLARWAGDLERAGFILAGWELLGTSVFQRVQKNLPLVVLPTVGLVLLSLWFAFRRPVEILLSLVVLAVSGLALLAVMRAVGWSWNLLNLMALPLILGSGVDYSIFMQLALRRHHGNLAAAHRSVGRALLLCGGTTMAGLGSLAWSTNTGIASLGAVCAVGIGLNMGISVWLLPIWWRLCVGDSTRAAGSSAAGAPSKLYGPLGWRAALALTRVLPPRIVQAACLAGSRAYWLAARRRREVVVQNLLPVVEGDRARAEQTAARLGDQFARKLVDLWRYESGGSLDGLFGELRGWENYQAAESAGRGVLLLTPHLGNWEFGAPLLAKYGIKMLVITLAEPGAGLTEMRQAARARWGIETFVIGSNPFAFVEIIKRLGDGAKVALLVDRPPAASAVTVELFGRPLAGSMAAAELARASGCALLPVYLPRTSEGYAAHILPPISYDRRALGDREARRALTGQILRAFEPAIRQHPDQWYHFVPLWTPPATAQK